MTILLDEILRSMEVWLSSVKNKSKTYVDPELEPVILVPGIAGSILEAIDDQGKVDRVWVRVFGADYQFRIKLWSRFDPSTGKTVSLDQKINVVVPEDRYGLYAIDVLDPDMIIGRDCFNYFHEMIIEMTKWGFQEGKTLFGFGYDFRQSNRFQGTLERFAAKLESIYNASGGKRITVISHSMGGLLVKCFMCLHSDVFKKYVKNWIAIAVPFQGAPGYVTSALLNGMSFVEGWEQNLFITKWSMHQLLIECPSIYELMACQDFHWKHNPLLEVWRENHDNDGNSNIILESYSPEGCISIFDEALSNNTANYDGVSIPLPFNLDIMKWADETRKLLSCAVVPSEVKFYNIYATGLETPHSVCYGSEDAPVTSLLELPFLQAKYIYVDGDGTVPMESAKADGFDAVARVGVPSEHRSVLCDCHVFRILKHWLKAGEPDPYYDPLNDYVILPTAFEMENRMVKGGGLKVSSPIEEWDIVVLDQGGIDENNKRAEEETLIVHPYIQGTQHVELKIQML